jgi:chromosome segregation ATPase
MLLNALVGEEVLPTNDAQTTAINTFIYGVDEGQEPHIEILKRNGEIEELPWESGVIEKWGTELNDAHRDARAEVDRIRAYSDHPLLQNDLVLIDTPGFEGLYEYHEDIAHQAMNEAHVAIWLQATDQLGGNSREWDFVRESVSQNFDKFITVVNKWDRIIEPPSHRENQEPEEVRAQNALKTVRDNFRNKCGDILDGDELDTLMSERNLLGVSALWAFNGEPEKRAKSNIDSLAERIEQLCKSSEADEQRLAGPLKSLTAVQEKLHETIESERTQLAKEDTLGDLKREIQRLDNEIESVRLEFDRHVSDIEASHDVHARQFQQDLRSNLVKPLEHLEREVDSYLDQEQIRRRIENGSESIGLPGSIQTKMKETVNEVEERWAEMRGDIEETLEALATDFEEDIEEVRSEFDIFTGDAFDELPSLDLDNQISLAEFEKYQQKKNAIESRKQEAREELEELESNATEASLEMVKERRERQERRLEKLEGRLAAMGPTPSPRRTTERREKDQGGIIGFVEWILFGQKKVSRPVTDDSPVREHKKKKRKLERQINEKRSAIDDLIEEYEEKYETKLSKEQAEKKYRRQVKKLEKKESRLAKKKEEELERLAENTLQRLRNQVLGSLESTRKHLSEDLTESVGQLFERHSQQLEDAVEEQYLEPLETRRDMRAEKRDLMEKKKGQIESRRQELEDYSQQLSDLRNDTETLASEVTRLHSN